MNDCANVEIRDRLPDFVNGLLAADARQAVEAHLGSCADCSAELELLRLARGVLRQRPAVDVAALARAIAPRAPLRPRGLWRSAAVRRAAALTAIVAGAGASWAIATRSPEGARPVAVATAVRESVTTQRPSGAEPATMAVEPALTLAAGVEELSAADLDAILSEIESLDAMPSEDPQPLLPTLGGMEGGV